MNPRWRNGLVGAALASLAGLFFWWTPSGDVLVNLSYDLPFLFRSDMKPEGITILYMDPDSDARLGQLRNAAWDRAIHARLLDRLRELHAKAVVFDIVFPLTTHDAEADRLLVEAAKAFGNVVVAAKPTQEFHVGEEMGWRLMTPFPDLADAARSGVVEAADAQKTIRRHYCRDVYDYDAPCLASSVAQLTQTTRRRNCWGRAGSIIMGRPARSATTATTRFLKRTRFT